VYYFLLFTGTAEPCFWQAMRLAIGPYSPDGHFSYNGFSAANSNAEEHA
jgi:hypothetical protein